MTSSFLLCCQEAADARAARPRVSAPVHHSSLFSRPAHRRPVDSEDHRAPTGDTDASSFTPGGCYNKLALYASLSGLRGNGARRAGGFRHHLVLVGNTAAQKNMDPAYKTNAELETPTATHTFTHPVGSKGKSTAIHSMCLRASASGNTLVIVKISTPMRPLFPFEIVAFCQDVTQLPRLIVTRSCLSRLSSAVRSAGRRARVRFRTVQVDQKKAPALHFVITDDRAARMVGGERVREAALERSEGSTLRGHGGG